MLAVEPHHTGAAIALAPIYAQQEKWARLITVYEIELAAAPDIAARLAKISQIRQICEQKLASRTLAFTWTLRAFDLSPAHEQLYADVMRLAQEPEQWRDLATVFEKHTRPGTELDAATRLKLLRDLAKIASRRLDDPDRARGFHRQILELDPESRDAEQHLEELAIQLADWTELLGSYRRRVTREQDATERASLLIEIASLQEEKLVDLDGAAATYREALATLPNQVRALRSLARIEEARGDWEALVEVLGQELASISSRPDGQPRFELLMRLGGLEEQSLERPAHALPHYRDALAVPAPGGTVRPQAVAAICRLVLPASPGGTLDPAQRIAAVRLVLPHLEAAKHVGEQATALELLRASVETSAADRLDLDRQLMRLYHSELGDPGSAWQAGLRVISAEPGDAEVRGALGVLAGQLGRDGEWAGQLASALATLRGEEGPRDEIRAIATELAKLAGDRLGDPATAERAWIAVLEVDPDAADAFEALAAGYRRDQRYGDLRALLERRADVSIDDTVRLRILLELAGLEEELLGQPSLAAAAHKRVLEIDPSYLASYQALDRLYTASAQWQDLEELLGHQVDHASTPAELVELGFRRAGLFARRLGDPKRAVDLLDDVVSRDRGHAGARVLLEGLLPVQDVRMRVARLLEPLYEHDKQWKDLVGVLRAQRSMVVGTEAVELLSRIATIEEAELGGAGAAFEAWVEVLALDPTHERARGELARLAQQLGRWPEATAALETASTEAPSGDVTTRAALLGELATYYDVQLGDAPRAITAYRRLLDMDSTNAIAVRKAASALARLYEENRSWRELRDVTHRLAEWAEDAGERRALLARVAVLEEEQLAEPTASIATWRELLADQPADAGALHALERLYQRSEQWRELIDVLRRKLDGAGNLDASARDLLARIAEIHEVMLEEPEEAMASYIEILDRDPDDRRALTELARLYRDAARPADLLDLLERQVELEPEHRTQLQIEIAQLLAGPLLRPGDALERWSTVLQERPDHAQALGAVEGALADPELRLVAADILRPVYDNTNQHERLAILQERAADWTDDATAKLRALGEVVKLREFRLGDKAGAFAAQLAMLQHAATEPELASVVAETERMAGELGRESDLIDAYREVAPNVLDAEIQRRLYLDVADLARAVRRDHALAREYYQKVLDAQPDDRRALAALENIYRDTDDFERLTEILLRQADAASGDVDDRVGALVEAAGLYVQLGRPDDAISTWEQVLAVAPERRDAVEALEGLYREQGRWPDVVDLYERRLGFATSIEEAVALRVQLGEIHEKQLRDFETAIDNFSAALSGDSRNETALAAVERYLVDPDLRVVAAEVLEPLYVAQQRWPDLVRVMEARLEGATDPRDRLKLTRFVARLYEEQLEDFENASRWYAKVFREAPGDPAVRDQLQRLASMVDNWRFVAETYQLYLEDEPGDSDEIRDVAIAVAAIYDRRLGDVDAAYAAYRRALAIVVEDAVPNERELLRRLEELLGRAQRWPELVSVYDDVISRAGDDLRREALIKRARLLEDGVGDAPSAIEGWREVILATEGSETPVVVHAYREAVAELERLYRARSQWRELVELLEGRLARSQQPNEVAELRLKLAQLFEQQLTDLAAALDQYQHVIDEGPLWERAVAALERLVVHDQHRERITELLEPVYREQDWWQKLVVILDAKLDYVRDPLDQVATLHEIALIHEQRGGALTMALDALARAWRIDVADDESLHKFLALAAKLAAWDDAVLTLEEGAVAAPNTDLAGGLWARAATIHEVQRADLPRAIEAWRKVEEARPDDMVALAALDRLLAVVGRVEELVKVVERRAELSEDEGVRLVLLHRTAALYEEVLADAPRAITAYRNVLAADDTDIAALDSLERLYRASVAAGNAADSRELASTIERKIELTTEVAARQELRHAAAGIYETELGDIYQAIGQLTAVLDDDASDQRALAELDRIYHKQKIWPELLDIVDRRALLAVDTQERADLAFRAAQLVETELSDSDAAIPRYGAVLQILPAHAGARAALETLMQRDEHVEAATTILERGYRADREAAGLVRVYERRLAAGVGDSSADWAALADVHETIAGAPAEAFAVWSRALAADPAEVELLAPLLRIAETQRDRPAGAPDLWQLLATRLDQVLTEAIPPDAEHTYVMRLGQIAEDHLADLDRAAAAYERAASGHDPEPAWTALERVYRRAAEWPALASVLRREAEGSTNDAQIADLMFRLAELQESTLHDRRAAIVAYREVLNINPTHPPSRLALERMLLAATDAPDIRGEIVEILEPLLEQEGDAPRLIGVLEAKLAITSDPLDQASLLQRLVELAEQKLADRGRALDGALRWLAIEPGSNQALAETERLAERLGQWPEVGTRLHAIVHAKDSIDRDPATQVALLTFLGRVQRERLGQLDDAATSYRAALALDPDAVGTLDELIKILRQRGDQGELAEALRQRGKSASEPAEQRAAYAEVAGLCERAGDRAGAIAAWREVIHNDDSDRGALDELARLYRATADRGALVDTLGHAARLATSPDDEKQLRVEIAQLETEGPRAVAAWQAVLDLDADDLSALTSLQFAHARAEDWLAVADVQTRRLDLATATSDKVAIHAEMAQIAEQQRGAKDDAIASWYAALDADPTYRPAFAELERLLAAAGRHHDLVEHLEKVATQSAVAGDAAGELGALARAADVWEGPLDNPDAAGEILEKILAREPGSVAALTRLSKIYERAGDWDRCKATLEQALKVVDGRSGRDAADLFFRLGEVARVGFDRDSGDAETAILHLQQALKHDPAHDGAIHALEKLARDRRDNGLLADMLQRRVSSLGAPAERIALLVEIADLERKAGKHDAALAALARAANDAPDDVRVLAPLADLFFAANRLDEAAPIYDRLAQEAKAGRRMKDVARFRQRQGGILEARGDVPAALLAYEEALRVNPTDVVTMSGLGRLYFEAKDWEKARKIYQSLVLQNIDADAGVTKADVYFALGTIHLQLGQPPKAKSMFQRGLEIEPHDQRLKDALSTL
ncbi:MAG: tetratricopeptide repeat protein [Myxococcota bacterium]|nr:tetratricopeptide repeat protein [Myxococcota bacterium]